MVGLGLGQQYQYHHWIERGDLLKSNARFLQFQLRRRFRVAVDRHLYRRPHLPGGNTSYFSSVIERFRSRFRDLRRHTLLVSSSAKFSSRKRVVKDIFTEEESAITRMLQTVAVPVLGNVCHVFMHGLNRVQIYGAEKLHKALHDRSKETPLITVSNHVASIDDPLVIASLLPPRVLMDAQQLRWTLCASDRCFKNPATSAFFRSVKVLPVSRGDGIYQKGLDMAISKLNNGGWVHIFPEGSRSRDGGRTVRSAKRGVGRLILDADNTPVVIPFVHTGMQEIMPIGASLPRIGKIVTVLVGDPIKFDDLVNSEESEFASRGSLYDAISSRVGERLQEMKSQVDKLALDQSKRMKQLAVQSLDRAADIIEHVDWESLGMKNYIMSSSSEEEEEDFESEENDNLSYEKQPQPDPNQYNRTTGFTDEGSFMSRIRSIVGPNELMGFAARTTLLNQNRHELKLKLNPIRVWRQFLEANCGTTVLLC